MRQLRIFRFSIVLLRLCVAGIFLYAGILKLQNPVAFADSIAGFQMVPQVFITLIAVGLPLLEIFLGGLLLTGWLQRRVAFSLLLLSLLFFGAFAQAVVRGLNVDCGCFGELDAFANDPISALFRSLLLVAACGFLYWRSCAFAKPAPG